MNNKCTKCYVCNGTGFISNKSKWFKKTNYSYENRFHKYLKWVECPRCLGVGRDTKESGAKQWDKFYLSVF